MIKNISLWVIILLITGCSNTEITVKEPNYSSIEAARSQRGCVILKGTTELTYLLYILSDGECVELDG